MSTTRLALLSTRGIAGAEAGTALKSMLMNMNRQTDKTVGALEELNVSLYDSHGQMRSLPDVIGQLERAFSTLTDEQRDQYMQTLAGTYGIKAMSTLIAEGTEGWYAMAAATERATGIQEKAAAMAATHAGRVEALEGNVETLGITIGEKLLPVATDWVEWAIEMVDQHGPALVEVTGRIAGAATALSEALQGQGSAELQTGLQMVGLVGALGVGAVAFSKLQPVIAGVGTALSDAVVGVQLMRGGASAAQVATLGWTAALGPLVAGLAAAGAVLLAVNKRMEVHKQIQDGTAEVGDQWTRYLSTQAAEMETATEMADAYVAKQSELAQIYEESGVLVKGAIDRQAILTANTDDLHGVLMETSDSYEDYLAAVRRVNQANMVEVETGEMVTGGYHRMTEAIQQDLLPAYSEQTWALLRGGEAMESGFLRAQMMGAGLDDLSGAMDENATEAAELAATHQKMSEMVAEAWTEFSESVRAGVDSALQAYREGNHEMLAEQKRALAEMLWNQTDTMVALGEITEGQALGMKVAIADEYGVIIDETDLATGKLLGMYSDWASGGATSADDIMAFLRNIGMETQTLANDTEAEIRRALEEHRAFSTGVSEYGGAAALAIDEMASGIGGSLDEMDTSLQSTRTELGLVEAAMLGLPTEHTFTLHLETEGSLPSLPDANHKYGEEYGYNAAGTEFWRGGLTFAGEEGPELLNLPRGTEILNARETAAMIASAASLAERLQAGGLAGGAVAGAAGGAAAQYHDHRKVEMVNYVRDEVDVELLARRVAGYITQRQR